MTNNFNALLTEHKAKLASIYADNNIVKNYDALGCYKYMKNDLLSPLDLSKNTKDIWHLIFIIEENCYIHKSTLFNSVSKTIGLTKYNFHPADPIESFGLTAAHENVKIFMREVFGAPHTTGFIEIPLKEVQELNLFTNFKNNVSPLIELEFLLHDAHFNLKLVDYLEKNITTIVGDFFFSCYFHRLLMRAQLFFPSLLDSLHYCSVINIHCTRCSAGQCSDISKHKLLRNISKEKKKTLLAKQRQLLLMKKENMNINLDLANIEQEIERLQYYINPIASNLYNTLDGNKVIDLDFLRDLVDTIKNNINNFSVNIKNKIKNKKKMTNNFYDLLTEHKKKLTSIYTLRYIVDEPPLSKNEALKFFLEYLENRSYKHNSDPYSNFPSGSWGFDFTVLGCYNNMKNNFLNVDFDNYVWHLIFIDKDNCYIHKSFFTISESLSKTIDLTKYNFHPADPIESFGLTAAHENVKIFIREAFGAPHTTGFIEIPLKEVQELNLFTNYKNISYLIHMEFMLHDAHFNLKLFDYLEKKNNNIVDEFFPCNFFRLFMEAQLFFPSLLDSLHYCSLIEEHGTNCDICSDTSKHKLLRNMSKDKKKTLLAQLRQLLLLMKKENMDINFDLTNIKQEIERLQYYVNPIASNLYNTLDGNKVIDLDFLRDLINYIKNNINNF